MCSFNICSKEQVEPTPNTQEEIKILPETVFLEDSIYVGMEKTDFLNAISGRSFSFGEEKITKYEEYEGRDVRTIEYASVYSVNEKDLFIGFRERKPLNL